MGAELQKRLIPLFHYALNPGGFLFLGTSETVGEHLDLFSGLDRKAKIYQRRDNVHGLPRAAPGRFLPPPAGAQEEPSARPAARKAAPAKPPLRDLTETALLQEIVAAAALVTAQGDILYLHGRTGLYLEPAPGEAGVNNILKMAREGLKHNLITALHKAIGTLETVRCPGLRVKTNGHYSRVNLIVRRVAKPATPSETPLFLVVLQEALSDVSDLSDRSDDTPDARIAALKQELCAKEEYLQAANEELETANEELKSSNEEMQSVNEEMQSTNEEMETSKEELQSVNEELATVNAELQAKVADLSRVNNDMNNLLAGSGIATVFVDHQLRILRFTPTATRLINLILADVGRPVGHIVSNLKGYDRLPQDVQAVLDTLTPREAQVQTAEGKWYTMRILPYRTLDNVIEGAVITFVDITDMVQTREALQKANERSRLAVVLADAYDAITVQDLAGRTLAWNPGAVRAYGWCEAEALDMNVHDRIPQRFRKKALARLLQLGKAEILKPYRTQRLTKTGKIVEVSIISTALVNEAGQMYAIATTERVVEGGSEQ
jgi:two-component system CheB/CheR fusion protein